MSQKPNPPQISFTFSLEAIQLILSGLAHLPLGQSKALFDAIEQGLKQQLITHMAKPAEDAKQADTPPVVEPGTAVVVNP